MDKEKPYLNPTLTLKELSTELSIPSRYLSQIINEHMQSNFYDYISKYRIEEAKKLLSDLSCDKTVLEILYEVGFNSKSSFNTAFKKFTGITPSRFKKESLTEV
jgi:YesN/AraC family two-component response regulator